MSAANVQVSARASHLVVAGAASLVALLTVAAYWPALDAGFVSDDFLILLRVSERGGLGNAAAYFGLRHFEYFRPLAFLSFAADWQWWGRWATGYHATAIGLHAVNALLVFVFARRLMGVMGATAAAALFALHPSSHEAVVWISSRFDLLATAWVLAGVLALRWRRWIGDGAAAVAFLAAVLSKESALALPIVAAAYVVCLKAADARRVITQLGLFAGAGVAYAWLRHEATLASAGGAARLPKLAALAGLALILIGIAQFGWSRSWSMLGLKRRRARTVVAGAVALVGALAAVGPLAPQMRGALTSAGFAAAHLLSPVALDGLVGRLPSWMWMVGLAALAVLACASVAGQRGIEREPALALLAVFLVAALIPVSSMTEGTRYLYLASVPAAVAAGMVIDRQRGRMRTAVAVSVLIVLGVNVWQIRVKTDDWRWASRMTSQAASTIRNGLDGQCDGQDVVLATAPVRVRGVYSNLNLEGLTWLQSCSVASLNTVLRMGLHDPRVEARWAGPGRLEITAHDDRGEFITSRDGRTFDVAMDGTAPLSFVSALGAFDATRSGGELRVGLTLQGASSAAPRRWFYFSEGALRVVPEPTR